jgi:hypothetical protein
MELHNKISNILLACITKVDERCLVCNFAAMRNIGLHKNLRKVLDPRFLDTVFKNAYAPRLKRHRVGEEKLLPSEIPAPRKARFSNGTTVLHLRRWENTSLSLDNVSLRFYSWEIGILTTVILGSMRTP